MLREHPGHDRYLEFAGPAALPRAWQSTWVFPSHWLVLQQLLRCH